MNKRIDDLTKLKIKESKVMNYETPSDWHDNMHVEVWEDLTDLEKLACGMHEVVEMILLHLLGVSGNEVDTWDTETNNGAYDEHMYDKDPRYKRAHNFATRVEKAIVRYHGGMSWREYNKRLDEKKIRWNTKKWSKT